MIATLSTELARLAQENALLRHRIQLLTRRIFGRRSEQGVGPGQGVLPFEPAAAGAVGPDASDEDGGPADPPAPARAARRHRGRRPLERDIPRERIEVLPPPAALACPQCQRPQVRIGEDLTEELDYVPASFVIREYARPKFACPTCHEGVTQAALPARPIEKGRPGPGLLAHVVTAKYADHLPLYRLEGIFARHAITVTRRTLAEWNGAVADLLAPIVVAMHLHQVLAAPWIQCDDTTVAVQVPDRTPATRQGHLWVYRGAEADVVYDFTWARNRDGPLRMLAGYRGYLQVDAAPAYDELFATRPEIVEVGCWAHARRRFKDAVPTAAVPCAQVLVRIGELYGLERAATERRLSAEARGQMRQERAQPLLRRLRALLEQLWSTALPKSPLGDAVGYALRHWQALTRYTEDGRLKIDNNGAENALRPIVLGRKNWLNAGSEAAAHRAAILCSLVQTCRNHGLNPFAYLRDVIDRVSTHPARRVLELTPRDWKRLRDEPAQSAA